ncbi:FHA domain-containing protein [Myxococcota bacterium]
MRRLGDFLRRYGRHGRDRFLRKNPQPVLVVELDDATRDGWVGFRTDTLSRESLVLEDEYSDVIEKIGNKAVIKLADSGSSTWEGQISVGRAINNDIAIPDKSVSKLHAYFAIEEERVTLTDADSKNGTVVNSARLKEEEVVTLKSRDQIRFGKVEVVFLSSKDFADLLDGFLARES